MRSIRIAGVLAVLWTFARPAAGEIVRIEITSRKPALNGQAFGPAGPFEEIRGIAYGEIDPRDPKNAVITDIELAPKNSRGRVEYRTTFTLLKPVDMTKSPGVLLYNIVNRGNHNGPNTWHVGGDPGDGFLYSLGHAILWSGWQGDLPIASVGATQEGIDVPIAKNRDGAPVTGKVWARFIEVAGGVNTQSLPGAAGRAPATLETANATLISARAETPAGQKSGVETIAPTEWAFADCRSRMRMGSSSPLWARPPGSSAADARQERQDVTLLRRLAQGGMATVEQHDADVLLRDPEV